MARMVDEAVRRGGNAIIAMRFDSGAIGQWSEICAYGTAVTAPAATPRVICCDAIAADLAAAMKPRSTTMSPPNGYIAITQLVYRYAELIDRGDLEGVGTLFAHGTVDTGDGTILRGKDAVRDMYGIVILYPDGTPRTRHVTTNLIIDVDEEAGTGSCRSYVTVFQQTDDFPLQPVYQNRYEDTFVRADATWRFEHRLMCDHRPGDTSHHLDW